LSLGLKGLRCRRCGSQAIDRKAQLGKLRAQRFGVESVDPLFQHIDALAKPGNRLGDAAQLLDQTRNLSIGVAAIQDDQRHDGEQDDKEDVFHEAWRADGRAWPLRPAEYRPAHPRA
jgi:hypothetical protein